jgi:hypothetical protein
MDRTTPPHASRHNIYYQTLMKPAKIAYQRCSSQAPVGSSLVEKRVVNSVEIPCLGEIRGVRGLGDAGQIKRETLAAEGGPRALEDARGPQGRVLAIEEGIPSPAREKMAHGLRWGVDLGSEDWAPGTISGLFELNETAFELWTGAEAAD